MDQAIHSNKQACASPIKPMLIDGMNEGKAKEHMKTIKDQDA